MNPKSTDCEPDALTTTLSRRSDMKRSVQDLVIVFIVAMDLQKAYVMCHDSNVVVLRQ